MTLSHLVALYEFLEFSNFIYHFIRNPQLFSFIFKTQLVKNYTDLKGITKRLDRGQDLPGLRIFQKPIRGLRSMLTTTELNPLTRTLTDVLDDEMLHLSANRGQECLQTPKTWKNRSLEDLLYVGEQSPKAASGGDAEGELKQSMFSKYADPSLTTMSLEKPAASRKSAASSLTPVQATVSLNNVMNFNPFLTRLPSNTQEVRISSPALFAGEDEDMLNSGESFPPEYYYDENQKLFSWPLQDSATMSQDAMSIFDREFDDDLSEDEEDDNEDDDWDVDQVEPCGPQSARGNEYQLNDDDDDSLIFDRTRPSASFVGDDRNDFAVVDDEDGDDEVEKERTRHTTASVRDEEEEEEDTFDEDVLYDRNARKSSVVCLGDQYTTAPSSNLVSRESTPADGAKLTSSRTASQTSTPLPVPNRKKKYPSRRKSSNATPQVPTIKKRTSPVPFTTASGNLQEVHTCQLMNPITSEPCSKKFSRPYDLIRHQKTIHASKKKVFRCVFCIQQQGAEGYQKTFSRGDALSRHIKVKHELTGAEAQKAIQFAKENVEFAGA